MIENAKLSIVIADDDSDDRMLIADAFEESGIHVPLHFVEDGEQLLNFLRRERQFESFSDQPLPRLILLDLNMPKVDGRTALTAIKQDDELRSIPVIVMTTSKSEEEVRRTYALGVNSFISKPATFDALIDVVDAIGKYWIDTVALPADETPKKK